MKTERVQLSPIVGTPLVTGRHDVPILNTKLSARESRRIDPKVRRSRPGRSPSAEGHRAPLLTAGIRRVQEGAWVISSALHRLAGLVPVPRARALPPASRACRSPA